MNYKKIQTIVKHQFEWEKGSFFLIVLSMLALKIIFITFNPHSLIIALGLVFAFVSAFYIRPEFNGNEKGFSPKYLFGLPITRKELFLSQTIMNLFSCLPLILWMVLFYNYLESMFSFFNSASTASFVLFTFAILMGTKVQSNLYLAARGSLARESRESAVFFFKIYAYSILIGGGIGCLAYYLEVQYGFNASTFLLTAIKYLVQLAQTKWLGLAILAWALLNYRHNSKLSTNDKLSFKKTWNLKRELKFLGAGVAFTTASLSLAINATPLLLKGDLQVAVSNQDYKEIEMLLSSGVDVNKPNEFGMTPMMVALDSGDLKLVKFLEEKGANYNGEIKKKGDKLNGFDARFFASAKNNEKLLEYIKDKVPSFDKSNSLKTTYPIHVAAKYCKPKVVDYLISNGVDIEARNENGLTPIVIAARNNCFESVISLKEAGARFDVKDLKGKFALHDLGKKASPELNIFVKKIMRAPASK